MSFSVAGVALRDILTCLIKRRQLFCVTSAILLRGLQKATCIFGGRCSTLDMSMVVLRGRRSTLDVSCCVFFANRNVRAASSGGRGMADVGHRENVVFVAGAAFGEDPSCVVCHFAWQVQYL